MVLKSSPKIWKLRLKLKILEFYWSMTSLRMTSLVCRMSADLLQVHFQLKSHSVHPLSFYCANMVLTVQSSSNFEETVMPFFPFFSQLLRSWAGLQRHLPRRPSQGWNFAFLARQRWVQTFIFPDAPVLLNTNALNANTAII